MELKQAFRTEPILPLATILGQWTAGPSRLRVLEQGTVAPPHANTVAPPLARDATLLRRITAYQSERFELSRHLAFTDLGAIDMELAARLADGRTNLGQVFGDPRVEKALLGCGDGTDADDEVLRSLAARDTQLAHFLWRRYCAAFESRPAFLVIEILDLTVLENLARPNARVRDLKR